MTEVGVAALRLAATALIVALGGTITGLACRAYRRTGSPAMGSFAVGVGIITVGGGLGGALEHLLGAGGSAALLLRDGLTAVGLGILLASLYVDGRGRIG